MGKICINNSNVARAIWNNRLQTPAPEVTAAFPAGSQFYQVRTHTPTVGERVQDPLEAAMPVFVRLYRPGAEATRFDCFDKAVYNAVCSLYESGLQQEKDFSLTELLRLLTGEVSPTLTKGRREKLEESLEKLSQCQLTIDAYYEVRGRWQHLQRSRKATGPEIGTAARFGFLGDLLPVKRAPDKGGRTQMYYRISDPGALYEYTRDVNSQFITVPDLLLRRGPERSGRSLSNIAYTSVIAAELLQQMEILRNRHNKYNPRTIAYDTPTGLLARLGLTQGSGPAGESAFLNKKAQIHKEVLERLEYWRSIGYLEQYEVKLERRRIVGVEIQGKVSDPWGLKCVENDENSKDI